MSSTAVRGTLEGPIAEGSGSWLISGRHSYLDQVHWLNNAQLVGLGLGVERATSPLPANVQEVEDRVLTPGATTASFYDVHAKFYLEGTDGKRLMISGYLGGNETLFDATRIFFRRENNTFERLSP